MGIPGHVLEESEIEEQRPGHELEHNRMPDPTSKAITALHEQMEELAREVAELRQRPVAAAVPRGLSLREIEQVFRAIGESAADTTDHGSDFEQGAGI